MTVGVVSVRPLAGTPCDLGTGPNSGTCQTGTCVATRLGSGDFYDEATCVAECCSGAKTTVMFCPDVGACTASYQCS